MTGFDPDAYLAAKVSPPPASDFDPDAYLRGKDSTATGEALGHGFMDMIPFGEELQSMEDVAKRRLMSGGAAIAEGRGLGGAVDAVTAPGFWDEYGGQRDSYRAAGERAKETNPVPYRVGQAGGLAASMLIPVPGSASKTLLGKVASGLGTGAVYGLGSSEADLTKGEVGDAAIDTGLGALAGGALGAVGHGVGKVVDAVKRRAAGGFRLAEADAAAAQYGKNYAAQKSAQGAFGGEAAAVQNRVGHWREVAANAEGRFTPAEVAQAQKLLASPEANEAIRRAGANSMKEGGNRMSGSLQSAENAYDAARAAMDPDAIAAGAAASVADPIKRELAPRLWTLGHRLLPVMITGAGALVGGPEGAMIGGGVGGIMALTQGRPGIIIRNALRSPGVRRMAWDFVREAANSQLLGKFGEMLQRALTVGGAREAEALHESLIQQSPEYADVVGKAVLETGGEE